LIQSTQSRYRSSEALSLLNEHKYLSVSTLKTMMDPPMKSKKMLRTLSILRKKGFVKISRMSGTNCVFYRLSNEPKSRAAVATVLKATAESIFSPAFRGRDLRHHELVEQWIFRVRKSLPSALIIREWEIINNDTCIKQLKVSRETLEFLPDFVLLLPSSVSAEPVSIAFEIERTRKSNRRITRKLRRYATRTRLDGVIYACDSDRLADTVCGLYNERVKDHALRIGNYADNFFLLSDAMELADEPLTRMFNASVESTDFLRWIHILQSTRREERSDSMFREGAITPPQEN
jgi:hypothetical protein